MDGKIKFLTILLAALSVSAATSYATTSLYLESLPAQSANFGPINVNNLPEKMVQQISDDIVLELTKDNISLPFEYKSNGGSNSFVKVNTTIALENLTVTFQYTSISDGTIHIESFDYGAFTPAWGDGVVITYGEAPDSYYRVPYSVLEQCTQKTVDTEGQIIFLGEPELEVLGVFGFV
jgi:hypothetical protein